MNPKNRTRAWLLAALGGVVGAAAAGTAISRMREQRRVPVDAGASMPLGTLRTKGRTVVADDGVPLYVEVDEAEEENSALWARSNTPAVTLVFVHGYCLNLDCWHFQRAAYRGLVRSVFYDQRSHGRSGRSDREHATIDQLGRDLRAVIEHVAPDGPVVLVGHSMGGMSIIALAEQYPELIGEKVIGAALIATTAGGLDPSRILLPFLPTRLTHGATMRAVAGLQRGHRSVDQARRVGRIIMAIATKRLAFGTDVPPEYSAFLEAMLAATPFEVVADFFPEFDRIDKFDAVHVLDQIPVSIVGGTRDRLTGIGHSHKLHAHIPTSRLLECEDAGHMVTMERHEQVNAELDQLITAATTRAGSR